MDKTENFYFSRWYSNASKKPRFLFAGVSFTAVERRLRTQLRGDGVGGVTVTEPARPRGRR